MLKSNKPCLNILISYAYFNKKIHKTLSKIDVNHKLVIDSGAFTVWKTGKKIELKDYADFIKNLDIPVWNYFNLDVIGEPEKTMNNYNELLDKEFRPIPIFTTGENLDILEQYYKTSEIVALGGLVGNKNNENIVKRSMQIIGERKVHWLGYTRLKFVKHYRPFMCDSSNASTLARYASGSLYCGRGKTISVTKKDFFKKPDKEIIDALISYGINPLDFQKKENWKRKFLLEVGHASNIKLMLDVKKKLNTNMFLAINEDQELNIAIRRFKLMTKEKNG